MVLNKTGDARLEGGDCGLCDGVVGTERALIEVGEIFEVGLFVIGTFGTSLFDISLDREGRWFPTEDRSFSAPTSLDIDFLPNRNS